MLSKRVSTVLIGSCGNSLINAFKIMYSSSSRRNALSLRSWNRSPTDNTTNVIKAAFVATMARDSAVSIIAKCAEYLGRR